MVALAFATPLLAMPAFLCARACTWRRTYFAPHVAGLSTAPFPTVRMMETLFRTTERTGIMAIRGIPFAMLRSMIASACVALSSVFVIPALGVSWTPLLLPDVNSVGDAARAVGAFAVAGAAGGALLEAVSAPLEFARVGVAITPRKALPRASKLLLIFGRVPPLPEVAVADATAGAAAAHSGAAAAGGATAAAAAANAPTGGNGNAAAAVPRASHVTLRQLRCMYSGATASIVAGAVMGATYASVLCFYRLVWGKVLQWEAPSQTTWVRAEAATEGRVAANFDALMPSPSITSIIVSTNARIAAATVAFLAAYPIVTLREGAAALTVAHRFATSPADLIKDPVPYGPISALRAALQYASERRVRAWRMLYRGWLMFLPPVVVSAIALELSIPQSFAMAVTGMRRLNAEGYTNDGDPFSAKTTFGLAADGIVKGTVGSAAAREEGRWVPPGIPGSPAGAK